MYIGDAVSHDAVVHYNESFAFVQDDCVKVTGIVEEEFVGINAFSATRTVHSRVGSCFIHFMYKVSLP